MTDLTEQWDKGELPEGWYYLKVNEELANHPVIAECVIDYALGLTSSYFYDFDEAKIEQVLEKVPSYEEYTKLKEELKDYEYQHKQDGICYNDIFCKLELARKENKQLKERIHEFAEANQSLRKQLDGEKAKNRIDYYNGSPMDFLDECERDRKKNKIYKNLINNIREELIISDLRKTGEGNKFIVGILSKINQALGEDK